MYSIGAMLGSCLLADANQKCAVGERLTAFDPKADLGWTVGVIALGGAFH